VEVTLHIPSLHSLIRSRGTVGTVAQGAVVGGQGGAL